MKKVLVATKNPAIIKTVQEVSKKYATYFDPDFFDEAEDAIRYIDYELPELKVLDFTSNDLDCNIILDTIKKDPWLHYGGIVAVVKNLKAVQEMEEKKDGNILIVFTLEKFFFHFERLLRIIWQNQQFLFNRGMQDKLGGKETGCFICGNDPFDIIVYANFLVSYLYSSNRIDDNNRYKLQTALMELLLNALEHGNCEITYDEKTVWLEQGKDMLDLIAEKNKNPGVAKKHITITYKIEEHFSSFSIKDDGNGFDWKSRLNSEISLSTHGMGIKMSESLVSSISYNDKGNEVTFTIPNLQNSANTIPGIMYPFESIEYSDKQVVCRENERTNDLFFIVSGRYAVYAGRKLVSVLTPNDMFIGEMSFLLNDKRSATILSIGRGRLIKIPKSAFLGLIRKNPHYGLFLSKLLAQRLVIQTQKTMALNKAIQEKESK